MTELFVTSELTCARLVPRIFGVALVEWLRILNHLPLGIDPSPANGARYNWANRADVSLFVPG